MIGFGLLWSKVWPIVAGLAVYVAGVFLVRSVVNRFKGIK